MIHIKYISLILLTIAAQSCGKIGSTKQKKRATYESCLAEEKLFVAGSCYDGSGLIGADLRTLLFGDIPLIESLSKEQLEICILTDSEFKAVRPRLEQEARSSIVSWLEPLQSVSHKLPKHINFVYPEFSESQIKGLEPQSKACPPSSDVTIVYLKDLTPLNNGEEDRAFALPTRKEIWLSPYNMRPGVMLHEFGHLFGLADIYIEDDWTCRKDFPNSIMCQTEWKTLMPVDRVAIQRNYCLYTDGEHPNCFNHQKQELLSFLPKKRQVPLRHSYTFRDPYIFCESDEGARFSFQPYSFFLVAKPDAELNVKTHFLGLYASDPSTIEESYRPSELSNIFTVEDVNIPPKEREALSLDLKIRDAQLHVQFTGKGQPYNESFSSCYIDPRMVEYYKRQGVDFPEALIRNGDYFLLINQGSRINYKGEIKPADGLRIITEQPAPEDAEIQIYARDSHVLVASAKFSSVVKVHEHIEFEQKYLVDVEGLNLAPGDYVAFVTSGDTALSQTWFVLPE